jgi:hypothetical protein
LAWAVFALDPAQYSVSWFQDAWIPNSDKDSYNSIIFTELSTSTWYWAVVNEQFLDPNAGADDYVPNWSVSYAPPNCDSPSLDDSNATPIRQLQIDYFNYTRLSNKDCLDVYSNIFQSDYADLIMVTADPPAAMLNDYSSTLLAWSESRNADTSEWLCAQALNCSGGGNVPYGAAIYGYTYLDTPGPPCNFKALDKTPDSWTNFGHSIEYCLARPQPSNCKLMMNTLLTKVVIGANAGIVAIMLVCLLVYRRDIKRSLSCFGDVIASYLEHEEESTEGMCLADKNQFRKMLETRGRPRRVELMKRRWHHTMGTTRRLSLQFLLGSATFTAFVGLCCTLDRASRKMHLDISAAGLSSLGWGSTTTSRSLELNVQPRSTDYRVTEVAIMSNLPQLFLTFIIYISTVALTEMTQAASYARFAMEPKKLRVSNPAEQRGVYFWGMPARWAIPNLVIGTLLQYVVSQTIVPFAVQIRREYNQGTYTTGDSVYLTDLAYSPLAIVVTFAVMLVFAVFILGLSFMRLPGPMPMASGSSLALSAAVHPLVHLPPDAARRKVKWGVVGRGYDDDHLVHCSFSIDDAEELEQGDMAL